MTTLTLSPFSFLIWNRSAEPKKEDTASLDGVQRRKIIGDMISAGACDSEYGVQMLMSLYPDQF